MSEIIPIMEDDGRISNDELNLFHSLNQDVLKFSDAFQEAMADNIITQEESELLEKMWIDIYRNSRNITLEDEKMTVEELRVLMHVASTIIRR